MHQLEGSESLRRFEPFEPSWAAGNDRLRSVESGKKAAVTAAKPEEGASGGFSKKSSGGVGWIHSLVAMVAMVAGISLLFLGNLLLAGVETRGSLMNQPTSWIWHGSLSVFSLLRKGSKSPFVQHVNMIQHVLVAACRHGRFRRGRNTPADGSGAAGREKSLNGERSRQVGLGGVHLQNVFFVFFVQSLVAFKVNLSLLDIIVLFGLQANGRRWKLSSQSGKEVGPPPPPPPHFGLPWQPHRPENPGFTQQPVG